MGTLVFLFIYFPNVLSTLENGASFSEKVSLLSPRGVLQVTVLVLLAGVVWVSGITDKLGRGTQENNTANDTRTLADTFGIPIARADAGAGKSLLVESYFDWDEGNFKLVEIIHPRCKNYSTHAIALPEKAISKTGEVRVRISATKRHYVNAVSLFAPRRSLDERELF